MNEWLLENWFELSTAVIAVLALLHSIHTSRRTDEVAGLAFPGVVGRWGKEYERGFSETKDAPPLNESVAELHLTIAGDRASEFTIADVKTLWVDDYWVNFRVRVRRPVDGGEVALIDLLRRYKSHAIGDYPEFVMVQLERRGGAQVTRWQKVRTEGVPQKVEVDHKT